MTRFAALVMIAGLQLAFIIMTLALLFVTRMRGTRWRARGDEAQLALVDPLQRIMLGDDSGEALAAALGQLRRDVAARELIVIGGTRLSPEQRAGLARLVRHTPWVEQTLAQASSRKWWKRMEAARVMVMVCDEGDEHLVEQLVTDAHAAVAGASTAAIRGCASPALVATIVRGLPFRAASVRLQQCDALRNHLVLASDAVVSALSQPASVREMRSWIQLAEVLATPEALAVVVPLASHADPEVRMTAARALRSCFSSEGAEAVSRLLKDEDWRVRAAAARAVGALNVRGAIPMLSESMHDESWWVRFRAGLALADLSVAGRAALAEARNSRDPFARDMATLIQGLSDGSRLELTSA